MKTQNKVSIIPLSIVLSILLLSTASAQWVKTNVAPSGDYISSIVVKGENIFAGTEGGVFRSTDNGKSWTAADSGLATLHNNHDVICLTISGANLFAGAEYGGVFRSTDNGTSWTAADSGLRLINNPINSLVVSDTNLYVMVGRGIFLSTNNGANWKEIDSGLMNLDVWSLAVSGTNLFAFFFFCVFLSTNNGKSWTPTDSGLTISYIGSPVVSGTNIFAGSDGGGVFLSTNNGKNWAAVDSGLTNLD